MLMVVCPTTLPEAYAYSTTKVLDPTPNPTPKPDPNPNATKVLDHEHVLVSDPDDKMGGLLCQEHARGGMAGLRGPSG